MHILSPASSVRLTQSVNKGGCASKAAATELRKILARVKFPASPPELLIGSTSFDDAAIYKISADTALVQTLDFFTPMVDTPRIFGQIAAANALSDVYAMGGVPKTAMAILAFPLADLDSSVVVDILQGASDKVNEARASFVGGHTIDDETLKFGLSVTGLVHPDRVWSNAGAKVGDTLILTKSLGTGTLTSALKEGGVTETQIQEGLESMSLLNNVSDFLTPELVLAVHAATDITGFGFAGHGFNLARASKVTLQIDCSQLPRFAFATRYLSEGFLTKAHWTNLEYVRDHVQFGSEEVIQQLVLDPQTSGGLLLSVDPKCADEILALLTPRFKSAKIIGTVSPLEAKAIRFS